MPVKYLNLNKVIPKIHPLYCISNHRLCFPAPEAGMTIRRGGNDVLIPAEKIGKPMGQGGATLSELRPALRKWFAANAPDELMCDLERELKAHGFQVPWTPPYNPAMQPIELFWRNSKQQVANGYRTGRTLGGVYDDLANYWFGCDESAKQKRAWAAFTGDKAMKLCLQPEAAMNTWVRQHGIRCAGEVGAGTFKYDESKSYGDDVDIDATEAEADALECDDGGYTE